MKAVAITADYGRVFRQPRLNLLKVYYPAETDSQLVKLVLDGSREAEDEIIKRHYRAVYHAAYGILGNEQDTLDVTQGLFAKARRILRNFNGNSKLGSYLYKVGVNAALDEVRRQKRHSYIDIEKTEHLSPVEYDDKATQAHEVISMALQYLTPRQRAVVTLRDIEGLESEEVAEILGITSSGVRTFLAEGRLRLKETLEKKFPEFKDWTG